MPKRYKPNPADRDDQITPHKKFHGVIVVGVLACRKSDAAGIRSERYHLKASTFAFYD